ncbi:hypothetical protein ASPCAL11933 [Aspergillus calidoustus]|uniref:RING-type domain-containing protein n=1 Tax=Aspergillus calidoustus TaxID=454130 RepID=A0A0U5H4F7_ASPCI|nr:hypothetical protein ASPCAL11933 [Aspergillus calidoustus]
MGNLVSKVRGRGNGFDQRRPKLHGCPSFPTPSYSTSSTYSEDFDVASSVGWSTFQSDDFNSTTISLSVPEYYANRARGDGNHYTSLAHGAGQSRRGSSLVARGPEERAITRKPITSRSVSLASTADTARSEHLVQGRDTSTYGSERVDSRQPPRPSMPSSSRKECIACLEELRSSSFPGVPITPWCEHPAGQICKPCLKRSLQAQLEGMGNEGFACPICKKPMSEGDVQKWAKPDVVRRYNSIRTRKTLADDPNFIWCSNPKCGGGQIHASGAESPIMTCMYCHARTCFTHQRPWHEGLTCYEYDHPEVVIEREERERREEAAAQRELQQQVEADEVLARELEAADNKNHRRREVDRKKTAEKRAAKQEADRRARQAKEERRRREEQERRQREDRQRDRQKRLDEERLGEAEVRGTSKGWRLQAYHLHKV